jgi:signal transduction histidine kinase
LLSESVGILGALQRKFLDRVKASTLRVGGMVEVLIQTILEGEGLELAPESVDLSEVVHQAVQEQEVLAWQKELSVQLDLPGGLPLLHFDRDALKQALSLLVQNACQATPHSGQITLRAQSQQGDNQYDYILLQVSDLGGGIPLEERGRLFTRRDRPAETPVPGTGENSASLSVVKTLIEAHGGRIWVDSEMGRGSTYSLILPVHNTSPEVAGYSE